MKKNVGLVDRGLRIAIGVILIALAAFGQIGWWGYIGIVPLLTGFVSFCPLYALIRFTTWKGA